MRSTVPRGKRSPISPEKERRFLTMLFLGIVIPLGLLTAFVSADTQLDLSDLRFKAFSSAGVQVLGWQDLSFSEHTGGKRPGDQVLVCLYGYMMEPRAPDATNSYVRVFTLMPDAGLLIHPAHRHPDQMVTVQLQPGMQTKFMNRSLVLVQGRLESINPLDSSEPIYTLIDATFNPASIADLRSQLAR